MNVRVKLLGHGLMVVALSVLFAHCDSADFGSSGAGKAKNKKDKNKDGDDPSDVEDKEGDPGQEGDGGPSDSEVKTDDDTDDGNAGEIFDDAASGKRRETFDYGKDAKPPVVDYLFVIDNSPSMGDNVSQLQAGFTSLTADLFPTKSKVAIMNTMPGTPGNLGQSFNGAGQQKLEAANAEPGFMQLVSKASIAAYLAAGGDKAFNKPGCDNGWFGPADKDSSGARCFEAHTPISKKGGPCEAGLVSFAQFVEKSKDKRVFRKGGLANVVFISDTHDPGCDGANKKALDAVRPSFDELKKKVEANSKGLASFKVHTITPATACAGSEGKPESGTTYIDAAKAAKGQMLDLCVSKDFKGVLEKIVADVSVEKAVFNLSKPVKDVIAVTVDGEKVDDYEVVDGDTIEIKGLDPEKTVKIEITYSY